MGKRFGSLACETETHKLFHKSPRASRCATHSRSTFPKLQDSHDYNMSTENGIPDSMINASANINSPTYPRPNGKMFIYKRNPTLYPAQTKLLKAVYDSVSASFASEVLALPPPYKMRKVKIIATPHGKEDPKDKKRIWTEVYRGTQTAPPGARCQIWPSFCRPLVSAACRLRESDSS
jgi:hypothetical protein